jgi:hypothetical protein
VDESLFSFQGRVRRSRFWTVMPILLALNVGLLIVWAIFFDRRDASADAIFESVDVNRPPAGHAPIGKTACDRCGGLVPSGYYLASQDNQYGCEKCRAATAV